MSEWLLLRFDHGLPGAVAWMTATASGQTILPPQIGSLAQVAQLASERRLCVLVPASDITTLDVDLPARAGAKLLQAVPFAVEDQLAENVEDLHFALGDRTEGQPTAVAAVSRATFSGWLEQLSSAGLRPERMHADAALLPDNPGQVVALIDRDMLLMRAPGLPPMALPSASLAESLELALGHLKSDATQPGLLVYASAQDWQHQGAAVDAMRPRFAGVKVQLLSQGALPLLAQQLPSGAPINLLQGEHVPRGTVASGIRAWRWAAVLAVLCIGVFAAGRYWEQSRLRQREAQLDAAVQELARAAVPESPSGRDPRRAVEDRLKAIRAGGAAGSGDLLTALSAFVGARSAAPDAELQGFAYRGGALEVRLKAPAAASLERIREQLVSAGWAAVLKGGAARGASFEGRLEIKPQS